MASKRARENSVSPSPGPEEQQPHKMSRVPLPTTMPLLCTLPPTCNPPRHQGTPLAGTAEMEAHYATYHAHVCGVAGCGCVFPDARLLELVRGKGGY